MINHKLDRFINRLSVIPEYSKLCHVLTNWTEFYSTTVYIHGVEHLLLSETCEKTNTSVAINRTIRYQHCSVCGETFPRSEHPESLKELEDTCHAVGTIFNIFNLLRCDRFFTMTPYNKKYNYHVRVQNETVTNPEIISGACKTMYAKGDLVMTSLEGVKFSFHTGKLLVRGCSGFKSGEQPVSTEILRNFRNYIYINSAPKCDLFKLLAFALHVNNVALARLCINEILNKV